MSSTDGSSGVVEFFNFDEAPEQVKYVPPRFPLLARKAGLEGYVFVQFVLGTDGMVQEATVLRGHEIFREAALKAVRQWVYAPAKKEGEAVRVRMTVPVMFRLGGRLTSSAERNQFTGKMRVEPNPFNPETVISYDVRQPGKVVIDVFDLSGSRVVTLVDQKRESGSYQVRWDARNSDGEFREVGMEGIE